SADADAVAILKGEAETAEQPASAKLHPHAGQFQNAVAERRRWWNDEFHVLFDRGRFLRRRFIVTLETIFLLAPLRARALAHPGKLLFQKHLPFMFNRRIG